MLDIPKLNKTNWVKWNECVEERQNNYRQVNRKYSIIRINNTYLEGGLILKDWCIYPSVFTFEEDGVSVEFPDLQGCYTCGETEEEAYKMAKEALGLHIFGLEKEKVPIPNPSSLNSIELEENQAIVLIEVYLPSYRFGAESKSIKKTLTIPKWLNDLSEENNINFSKVLQEALKKHLGV